MPVEILMPALSPTMKSGTVSKWYKEEGDTVNPGDILADIESDKAVMEFEYVDEPGILHKILAPGGTKNVEINKLIALVRLSHEDPESVEASCRAATTCAGESPTSSSQNAEPDHTPHTGDSQPVLTAVAPPTEDLSVVRASPLARKMAANLSVDISKVVGTGPYGRVLKADVCNAASSQSGAHAGIQVEAEPQHHTQKIEIVEISSMRRVISDRLAESKRTIPHFYLVADCAVEELLYLRAKINESTGGECHPKITVNDFTIRAAALAIKEFPDINSSLTEDKIVRHQSIDVSFAVSVNDGLITPVIRDADKKSLLEISKITKSLASRAKDRRLQPHEFQGGSLTLSNLGMFEVREFYAIINPPQSCILAIGQSQKRAVVIDDNIVARDLMTVTLSVDHRLIDGVLAAKFLNRFKFYIENPLLILV